MKTRKHENRTFDVYHRVTLEMQWLFGGDWPLTVPGSRLLPPGCLAALLSGFVAVMKKGEYGMIRHVIPAILLVAPLPATADMSAARAYFEARQWQSAYEVLQPLSHAGNAEAEVMMGDLFGLGLYQDAPKRAVVFWHRAALKGHPLAQLRLSRAYRSGGGVALDRVQAALWARLAVVGGAPLAKELAQEAAAELQEDERRVVQEIFADMKPYLYPFAD